MNVKEACCMRPLACMCVCTLSKAVDVFISVFLLEKDTVGRNKKKKEHVYVCVYVYQLIASSTL